MEERVFTPEATDQWLWIAVLGGFAAFYAAFGIGANDVANAFATSVAADTLSTQQALAMASVFELLGAILLGAHVSEAIRADIVDVECFEGRPGVLMFGMLCVLTATGTVLLLATHIETPVSTTQATIGAILGMTLSFEDPDCVVWHEGSSRFPYFRGISAIVVSWVIAPVVCGGVSHVLFFLLRRLVLSEGSHPLVGIFTNDPFSKALKALPLLVCCTIFMSVLLVAYESGRGVSIRNAAVIAAVSGFLGGLFVRCREGDLRILIEQELVPDEGGGGPPAALDDWRSRYMQKVENRPNSQAFREEAEHFPARAEELLKSVQVLTAVADSIAHGANDVSNAMGPFAVIYFTFQDGMVSNERDQGNASYWILTIGGIGIIMGLWAWGHKVVAAMGPGYMFHSPSRGFCVEFSSSLVVLLGTLARLPLSTTHCQVGAQTGVAWASRNTAINRAPFDWKQLCKIALALPITMLASGILSAAFFSFGLRSPCA